MGSGSSCWPTGWPGPSGHMGPHLSWHWRPRMQADFLCPPLPPSAPALRGSVPWEGPQGPTWAVCMCTRAHTFVLGQRSKAEVWDANATSRLCPGFSRRLCLGQPRGSGSLGFIPREVGGWAGGGAFCWQAPLRTAVPCRCLWPSSVQYQGPEPDSSVI